MCEDSLTRGKRPKNMGERSLESRFRRAFAQPTIKRRRKWDSKMMSKDTLGLTHGLAWSAAGGAWGYPRPYQVCPWDSDTTESPGYQWGDLFPLTFPLMVRQFMNTPERKAFQIHSRGCCNAIWRCTRDSVRRDPKLADCPRIQVYVLDVIVNTVWYKDVGRAYFNDVPSGETSFLMTDHLEDDTPTTNVKRGGSIQPQALGQQERSNVRSSAASSSKGQTKVFDPKTADTIVDRPKRAESSGSTKGTTKAEPKKRPARRGHGPGKGQGGAQTQPDTGTTDAPTADATPTTQTTPHLPSLLNQQQPYDATLRIRPASCRDIREVERERQEEREANLARAHGSLGRRNALGDAMNDQRERREATARDRAPSRTHRTQRGRLSPRRQRGRTEGRGSPSRTRTTSPTADVDMGDPPAA
jgi:hypothetical protein